MMVGEDFDARAGDWDDDPGRVERAREAAARVRERLLLTPTTRLLDFGAGTGLLAQALAADVGAVVLADPAAGMRAVAEQKAAAGVFGSDVRVETLDGAFEGADGEIDVVVSMMALHHVDDLPDTLTRLYTGLRPGGRLAVIDLERDVDASFHDPGFAGHHGFDRGPLAELLGGAGFVDVLFGHCLAVPKHDRTYDLFLVTARRPGEGALPDRSG